MYHIVHSIIIYNAVMDLSVHQRMEKDVVYIYTMECCSSLKKKEILPLAATGDQTSGSQWGEGRGKVQYRDRRGRGTNY